MNRLLERLLRKYLDIHSEEAIPKELLWRSRRSTSLDASKYAASIGYCEARRRNRDSEREWRL